MVLNAQRALRKAWHFLELCGALFALTSGVFRNFHTVNMWEENMLELYSSM